VPNLSDEGNQLVQDLAQRHGVSTDAATHMLVAVNNGNGTMAQFNHSEFGGAGQWMRGGMTMVSDLFNNQLKCRVDNICNDISNSLASHQLTPFSGSFQSQSQGGQSTQSQSVGNPGSANTLFADDPAANWWPQDLGQPAALGAQNNVRYAYFPASQRLAVSTGGDVWVYNTMDHQIGGFGQQQGAAGSITFTSQFGTVNLGTLPVVSRGGVPQPPAPAPQQPAPQQPAPQQPAQQEPVQQQPPQQPVQQQPPFEPFSAPAGSSTNPDDIIATLDRLGGLKEKGYITDEEFAAKKAELLSRL